TDVAGRNVRDPHEGLTRLSAAAVAGAPIYVRGRLAGLLVMGYVAGSALARLVAISPERLSHLLASVIDYASILSALAGEQIAGDTQAQASRAALEDILARLAFSIVFQPIVELPGRRVVGYEALTRFHDGVRPDVRFREAEGAGLGEDYEAATMELALAAAAALPPEMMLTVNASPDFVLRGGRLGQMLAKPVWPVVLELTEHSRIDDYDALRSALHALNSGIRVAVDDAGAGFSSLRHILELKPAFAKLDMAIVQGIEHDTVRQALVAGLAYFARHSDCSLIAEGVETAAEAATLERLGIGLAQGYLFGLPAALN
ncbi:MAG TPA: EAL domain-containing protein, partial [Candidatus Limnocylindrales bacterium]